jgi:hypothetical protein
VNRPGKLADNAAYRGGRGLHIWSAAARFAGTDGLLDHDEKKHPAFVPTANPVDAPAINAVADYASLAKTEKLGLNFH